MKTPAAAGTWRSPLTAEAVAAASVRLGAVQASELADGTGLLWWAEGRPQEGGRTQIVRRDRDGSIRDVLPSGRSANGRIHEYGGAAWLAVGSTLYFVEHVDQRIWRMETDVVGAEPTPITPEPPTEGAWRYAIGGVFGSWLICVQEVHGVEQAEGVEPLKVVEPLNRLVAVPVAGGDPVVLYDGSDFVGTPTVDPVGGRVAFVTWNHPSMPWDHTELWVGSIEFGTDDPKFGSLRRIAGDRGGGDSCEGRGDREGRGESICQPKWAPDGRLWFVSDRGDWWNLHVTDLDAAAVSTAVDPGPHEVGEPAWVFGQSRYGFLSDGRVVAARRSEGTDELVVIGADNVAKTIETPWSEISSIATTATTAVVVAASFTAEPNVAAVLVGRGGAASIEPVRPVRAAGIPLESISVGRPVTFPTGPWDAAGAASDELAHATFYPAHSSEFTPLEGERPPLLVMIHGGPTSAARAELRPQVQFWTSRGIAVVDVDYRGSTGYGRRYRDALRGQWGIADVEDCVAAARFLAAEGLVDPNRLLIRGGSAGGFTTLAALTFTDAFAAGASYYGVADLALLATETHKFEARYLDGLVGPYPETADRYASRSPLAHIDELDRPVIVFQGLEDRVVPPSQALAILDALAARGVPHASMMLEGEGHGFRKAENIRATLEAEWSFYLQVLGIPLPEGVPVVRVVS